MNLIVQSSIKTLNKSKNLLQRLTDEQLSDHTVPPYFSCIGSHIRHILDFYDCILEGLPNKSIDLTARKRDERMHCDCNYAIQNVERIAAMLQNIASYNMAELIRVNDDLGLGEVEIDYTLGSVLAQANSHAIHHYAIISYILEKLGIAVDDDGFGYNPTTPRPEINLN